MFSLSHRPCVYLCLAYAAGILFAVYRPVSCPVLSVGFACLWLPAFVLRTRRWFCGVAVCSMFVLLGALSLCARQKVAGDHVRHIAQYYRYRPVRVRGVVDSEVIAKTTAWGVKQQCVLQLKSYQAPWGWRRCSGKVQLNVFQPADLQYGQALETVGRLHRPFVFDPGAPFSYQEYLRHRDIHFLLSVKKDHALFVLRSGQGSYLKARLLALRDALKELSDAHFPATESALIKAMFLGDRADLPKHIKQLFQVTGTAHVLAISGLHIGIITALIWLLSQPVSSKRSAHVLVTIVFLLFYVSLSGGRVSVLRATIMAVTVLLSYVLDREVDSLNLVCFAALVVLIWNPYFILDIGFQLSFVCLFSILFLSPYVRQILSRFIPVKHPLGQGFLYSLSLSLGIWMGVLGLIVYYFQIVSPVAILANMLIVPLMTVIVALGAMFLLGAWWCPALVWPIAPLLTALLMLFLSVIKLLASLPGAYFHVSGIQSGHVFLYYGLIGGGMLMGAGRKRNRQ